MKIISKFKDYYDYVSYVYGVDSSIVYNRNRMDLWTINNKIKCKPLYLRIYEDWSTRNYRFKFLSVNAKLYVLVSKSFTTDITGKESNIIDIGHDWVLLTKKHPMFFILETRQFGEFNNLGKRIGVFSEELLEISRKLDTPVFTFTYHNHNSEVTVDENIPILSDLGFASLYSPEQIYQDISYFICNIMNESPDMAKPSKLSDTEKVVSHGFDKVISFRHRK